MRNNPLNTWVIASFEVEAKNVVLSSVIKIRDL